MEQNMGTPILSPDKRVSIDRQVEDILERYEISGYPINVLRIASKMGFDLFEANFKDPNIAGLMARGISTNNAFHSSQFIAVNKRSYDTRDFFTIAHEIGHNVLHYNGGQAFFERYMVNNNGENITEDQSSTVESEADYFAAALLMPTRMLSEFIDKSIYRDNKKDLIASIMYSFRVSYKAANRRLTELGITF